MVAAYQGGQHQVGVKSRTSHFAEIRTRLRRCLRLSKGVVPSLVMEETALVSTASTAMWTLNPGPSVLRYMRTLDWGSYSTPNYVMREIPHARRKM
jgi:hypothetical protein